MLGDILTDRHELDHYQRRNYENLRIPVHSTTHSQLFIRYRAIKTWNSLPADLRSSSSLSSFRNKLKLIIIIIIKRDWQCKAGRERSTPNQSEDPNPTTPTLERKKRKGKQ